MKNFPFGERSNGVINLRGAWRHDRAFEPSQYTRSDTQLNIDRAMTIINWTTLRAIHIHNRGSSDTRVPKDGPDPFPRSLPGDGIPETPGP